MPMYIMTQLLVAMLGGVAGALFNKQVLVF